MSDLGAERWAWLFSWAPALHSRNFRLFWLGQLVSVIGTSVQVVAEGWLIYSLTESTLWLGMVGFLALLPVIPISFAGGVLIDRVPRRKLLLATQTLLLLQALTFGLLAVTGAIRLWQIVALYFVFGAILAIDHPARRAFLVDLVEEGELANAVALNATVFNLSNLIGFALAGVMIAAVGVGATMMFNAATYFAPLVALLLIRMADVSAEQSAGGQSARFRVAVWEGLAALWKRPDILGVISLMAVVGGLAYPVFGMMPAFAEDVVGTGSVGLGILLSAGAFGSVLGTAVVARAGVQHRGRTLTLVSLALPLLVGVFAFTKSLWAACALLALIGLTLLVLQSLTITLVQVHIDNRVRGRVMSLYSQLHAGSDTIGNVMIGGVAGYIGLPIALALGAAAALIYAVGLRAVLPAVSRFE
ncbi:MAG: MFS transporter [Chloroflexota bacterium]|nr:MFS transporter [Chloroflexota bacterium]